MGDITTKQTQMARERRKRRARYKLHGTTERPRLSVFRSLKNIFVQVIDDLKGVTLVATSTIDPEVAAQIVGKTKIEASKVVGLVLAERAKKAGIESVVFDRGGFKYHGRVAALADGAREGGLKF
jgi:large subunit ribosomal protein L18